MKRNSSYWKNILQVSDFIQKTIEEGYVIPLQNILTPFHARNIKSSLNNVTFVEEAIESLLTKACISEVDEIPMCCMQPIDSSE